MAALWPVDYPTAKAGRSIRNELTLVPVRENCTKMDEL